jgi:hypothetical protein
MKAIQQNSTCMVLCNTFCIYASQVMFFLIGKYEGRVKRKWLLKDTVHWLVKQQNPASNTEQPFGAGPIITYPFLHTEKPILLCRVRVFVCVCV